MKRISTLFAFSAVLLITFLSGHTSVTHEVESHVHITIHASADEYMEDNQYHAYAYASISTPSQQGISDDLNTKDSHSFDIKAVVTGKRADHINDTLKNDFFRSVTRDRTFKDSSPDPPVFNATATATSSMEFMIEEGLISELEDSTVEGAKLTFNDDENATKYYKWRIDSHNHDATAHYPPGEARWHHSSTPYPEGGSS